MKNSLETKLGFFVVIVIIAAVVLVETLGGLELFQGGYRINALFDTVQDLKVGDSAKMAGVEIGKVDKIALDGTDNKVRVTLKIHTGVQVKTDSTATIKFTGLMGQNFVSIDFGTPNAPQAVDGTTVQSVEQPDLNAVMAKLNDAATGIENFGRSFSGQKIQDLIGPLMDFVKQNSGNLSGTITNIENITGQIASGQGTVGKLIYDQSLYNSAMDTVTNLQLTVAQARNIMSGITNGQGTIGKLITDDALYNSTTASMTNLNQILLKINGGQGTVGKLVNDQEFYKNAKLSLQKLDNAADGLEDQGPMSVLGIMANNLF
ncbi:MAG TPA: MlaD family protein [Verrucomicrobiae bacterium]|jgi:phospholipid/cholesterol/gamma-HCH transport system substrate-binding protein